MTNIAVFASGTGSNARKIIEHFQQNQNIHVKLIVSNKSTAPVLDLGKQYNISTLVINRHDFYKTENIIEIFNEYSIDFVALAGFLWLMPTYLVSAFENRMVNIHPALLPKYGGKGMYGMNVHRAIKAANEKESGITIHFVNKNYDEGSIIFQAKCALSEIDTAETIAKKVLTLEHEYFPKIIEKIIRGD